jgi:hypothetical protein
MDQILAYYRSEAEKVRGVDNIRTLRTKTIENIRNIASQRGFNDSDIEHVTEYFWNIFNIEFLADSSNHKK